MWIDITDREPENMQMVLVCVYFKISERRIVAYGHREGEEWAVTDFYGNSRIERSNVTHWMPIPEPPKE